MKKNASLPKSKRRRLGGQDLVPTSFEIQINPAKYLQNFVPEIVCNSRSVLPVDAAKRSVLSSGTKGLHELVNIGVSPKSDGEIGVCIT